MVRQDSCVEVLECQLVLSEKDYLILLAMCPPTFLSHNWLGEKELPKVTGARTDMWLWFF